jgi:hypothetical protein
MAKSGGYFSETVFAMEMQGSSSLHQVAAILL